MLTLSCARATMERSNNRKSTFPQFYKRCETQVEPGTIRQLRVRKLSVGWGAIDVNNILVLKGTV